MNFNFKSYDGRDLNEIFGYGGFCHIKEEGLDIKYWLNNDDFIRCIRLFKIKNLHLLLVYWVLLYSLFIG